MSNLVHINQLPADARLIGFGHRSGAESHMRCPRAYFLQYEYLNTGINQAPTPLYLKVGSAVHFGLADLLLGKPVDDAVEHAVSYLKDAGAYIALAPDQQTEQEVLVHGLVYAFAVWALPSVLANFEVLTVETGAVEYVPVSDRLHTFCTECLKLATFDNPLTRCERCTTINSQEYIALQSRPDAILRSRQTGETVGWSWKTIDDPTWMRRSLFHNDLQGYMEMYYGEAILRAMRGAPASKREIATLLRDLPSIIEEIGDDDLSDWLDRVKQDLGRFQERIERTRNIPTDIDYIQTVFLVKGKRKLLDEAETPFWSTGPSESDDDEYGGYAPGKIYRQMSHLCYRYRNGNPEVQGAAELYKSGPNKGKPKPVDSNDPNLAEESWSYQFFKPNNATRSALSTKWLTSPIQPDQIRDWVDRLATGSIYPSTMNDERNMHPLDKIIRFEEPLYRNVDKAAEMVEQQKRRFISIAKSMQRIREAMGTPDVDLLKTVNEEFPQSLVSCLSPWRCQFHKFCHTPAEAELDFSNVPDGFETREPHHTYEQEFRVKTTNSDNR